MQTNGESAPMTLHDTVIRSRVPLGLPSCLYISDLGHGAWSPLLSCPQDFRGSSLLAALSLCTAVRDAPLSSHLQLTTGWIKRAEGLSRHACKELPRQGLASAAESGLHHSSCQGPEALTARFGIGEAAESQTRAILL